MRRATCLLLCFLVAGAHAALAAQEQPWTLKSALKEMDKAAKQMSRLRAEVQYRTTDPASKVNGMGTIFMSGDGSARADIPGDNPAIAYWLYAYFVVYEIAHERLTTTNLILNPQVLAQYAMVGFTPAGSAMKKEYELNLTGEEDLDGEPVLFFVLTPKSKELRKTLSMIRLWVSRTHWLPVQQEVLHVAPGLMLTIRYKNLLPDEERPVSFFRPKVPPGTERIER